MLNLEKISKFAKGMALTWDLTHTHPEHLTTEADTDLCQNLTRNLGHYNFPLASNTNHPLNFLAISLDS